MTQNPVHQPGCPCDICSKNVYPPGCTVEEINNIKLYGYQIHIAPAHDQEWANIHTHGLPETYAHLDFQVVYPIDQTEAIQLLQRLVASVQGGVRFENAQYVDGAYAARRIKLHEVTEDQRYVYRILIPDSNGRFPDDEGVEPKFQEQAFRKTEARYLAIPMSVAQFASLQRGSNIRLDLDPKISTFINMNDSVLLQERDDRSSTMTGRDAVAQVTGKKCDPNSGIAGESIWVTVHEIRIPQGAPPPGIQA